jgi:hypothetical protein
MPFPSSITDIVATTIQSRTRQIADNVTKNNALLMKLSERGNRKPFNGGNTILQELSFAQNGNGGWFSGYDILPTAAQDVISAAEFQIKQLACPVTISGLEMLQNSGRERMIDMLEGRIAVGESTMANLLAAGVYADGTGSGGKELTGLNAAVPVTPGTGTYGGIDRATAVGTFWRSQVLTGTVLSATNIQQQMNLLYATLVRGKNVPDLVVMGNDLWNLYMASLQALQRFNSPDRAKLGFPSAAYMTGEVVLDGGIGNLVPARTAFMLNTEYIFLRPHTDRDMVPINPDKRASVNQDAEVTILGWAGNLTCSGAQFQGRLIGS